MSEPEQNVSQILKDLETGVRNIFTSESYFRYLAVMARFHSYSLNNTMLIYRQFPAATYVAGFGVWTKTFSRRIRRGEKGIRILAPVVRRRRIEDEETERYEKRVTGFRAVTVFDISQTEGEELPLSLCQAVNTEVQDYDRFLQALLLVSPVPVVFEEITTGANGFFRPIDRDIHIRTGMAQAQTIRTLLHEISHALLHASLSASDMVSGMKREVEAESVSYAVCSYYGIRTDSYSFGYIAGWSESQELSGLRQSLETIRKTAEHLIRLIDTVLYP